MLCEMTSGSSPDADPTGVTVLGRYRLEAVLGSGQMGVVYRATRETDGLTVALKVLRSELSEDGEYLRRFAREGDVASTLEHRHLASVIDRGVADGRHFLASRFLLGRSLAVRLRESILSVSELVRLVRHVGSGLDELHRLGLVHRDVKPSNVILDDRGTAVLTDFGVARAAAHSTLTKAGRIVGTVDYLAPEVIRGEDAVPASDIYSLGCLVYETAVGRPPFASKSIAEACIAHLREPPPSPRSVRSDLLPPLEDALLTALAKDPAGRPATGTAYARLLHAAAKAA
jgi:eukaryotic-like serine/threonine-protein kinase